MEWQPIETAPKCSRRVWVRRIHQCRVVKEGWAIWGEHPDPEFEGKRWLNEDGRFSFPTPTHWRPTP